MGMIWERIKGCVGDHTNHVRSRLLKGKKKKDVEKKVKDSPPPVVQRAVKMSTWNDGVNAFCVDEEEVVKKEFEKGVVKLRGYQIPDGKAWDNNGGRTRTLEQSRRRETVFKGIRKASNRRTARRKARRVKQELGKKQLNLRCTEIKTISQKIGMNRSGDFCIRSPLADLENKARDLTTEGFLTWMTWMVDQERSWTSLTDEERAQRYGEMGMTHHKEWLLKKDFFNGKRHEGDVRRICMNVWEQKRAVVAMCLDRRNTEITRPLNYTNRGKVRVEGCGKEQSERVRVVFRERSNKDKAVHVKNEVVWCVSKLNL